MKSQVMSRRSAPRWTRMISATLLAGLIATGCGTDDGSSSAPLDSATDSSVVEAERPPATDDASATDGGDEAAPDTRAPNVVSAEEGAAARARFAPATVADEAALSTASSELASSDVGFGECPSVWEPSAEEVADSNEATNGLVAAFDRFGVEFTTSTDDTGYVVLEYDYDDVIAQSVADSYWNALYPVVPPSQEELDAVIADNDVLAAQFDAAGVSYTRTTDSLGYEMFEYDYEDPAAQAAADAAWQVLYPPQPPTAEDLAFQTEQNTELAAAFDEAGIAYELVSDELGWQWLEWDMEDPATAEAYSAVIDQLYPPIAIDPIVDCGFVDDMAVIEPRSVDVAPTDDATTDGIASEVTTEEIAVEDVAVDEVAPDVAVEEVAVEEIMPAPIDLGPTPEEVAVRDAEVAAMVGGFDAALVEYEVSGESPWQTVLFDLGNDAAVPVVTAIIAARA